MDTPPEPSQLIAQLQRNHRFDEWAATQGLKQDFRCVYCDVDLLASYDNYRSWVCDHIVPLSAGGDGSWENIVVCCRTCNVIKGRYLPAGASRTERIADARRYVRPKREAYDAEVATIRSLVRAV
jgi:5-methylcytosine-specific restriction endonuclease McrA